MHFCMPMYSLLLITLCMMSTCETFMCSNEDANLKHHRNSLRGTVIDFIITFNEKETSADTIAEIASSLFVELCESFNGKRLKGDLCANVRYLRGTTGQEANYYHASSPCEDVNNPLEFFKEHMIKIGTHIDRMNQLGSMLLIVNIEEIHIRLCVLD